MSHALPASPSAPAAASSTGQTPDSTSDPRAAFRTKTVGTRMTPEEVREVEAAAKRTGKTLAEWLREAALREARQRPADPVELVLAEIAATRYMLLTLFHASAQAAQDNAALMPETVLRIRETADARKHGTAKKMLQEFRAGQQGNEVAGGVGK